MGSSNVDRLTDIHYYTTMNDNIHNARNSLNYTNIQIPEVGSSDILDLNLSHWFQVRRYLRVNTDRAGTT